MVRRLTWVVALAAVVLPGCGSSVEPEAEGLVGAWEWLESTGGFAGETRTPQSTGETMRLTFVPDGTVRLARDGTEVGATTWVANPLGASADTLTVAYATPLLGFEEQTAWFDGVDVLILQDGCCDGFTYRWRRR